MPLPLLIALFLAFGFDTPEPVRAGSGLAQPGMSSWDAWSRVAATGGGLLLVAAFAFVLGKVVARRVERLGRASARVRRAYSIGVRAVDVLSLVVYGWVIHELDWPRVVRLGFRLGDPILIDDALIVLPFLLAQFVGWWGVYAAERALRPARGPVGLRRYLWLKGRQSLGMVLPVAALYGLGSDLIHRVWPATVTSLWDQPVSLAVMGFLVLLLAPAFVRIAWPTHPLPSGPLRDRLEHMAKRVGFRCTDILVWDTNQVIVNAGVTGSLPWFRYVLLTDALVENLSPYEIAAVFGHEIGHIAHRHLLYFGFFLVGSIGLVALVQGVIDPLPAAVTALLPAWLAGDSTPALVINTAIFLLLVALYFLLVFGFVSRRFERQADVFGCRVVSCGRPDCPPHADIDGGHGAAPTSAPLCAMGIRIFVAALANVAMLNGMKPTAWSWRHGSVMRRIDFLESLVGRPEAEEKFQVGVRRMRRGMAVLLLTAVVVVAVATGFLQHNRRAGSDGEGLPVKARAGSAPRSA
jgi:STE24 endopeptidase